jgi:hypothetical protein
LSTIRGMDYVDWSREQLFVDGVVWVLLLLSISFIAILFGVLMNKPLALTASLLLGVSTLLGFALPAHAAPSSAYGPTTLASVDPQGDVAPDGGSQPVISGDGNYTFFNSESSSSLNMGLAVPSGVTEIFRRDNNSGTVELVSTDSSNNPLESDATIIGASTDGQEVLFYSNETNLVSQSTNGVQQIYVKNMTTGAITLATSDSNGNPANQPASQPSISGDGQHVTFTTSATNLVANDTGETKLLSQSSTGQEGDSNSQGSSISSDGRYVAFQSRASNFLPNTGYGLYFIFIADTTTNTLRNIIVPYNGDTFPHSNDSHDPGSSLNPMISGDGSRVVFQSFASNLVPNDTNQSENIFLWDGASNSISRINLTSDGSQLPYNPVNGDFYLEPVAFSQDGNHVLLESAGHGNSIVSGLTDNYTGGLYVLNIATGAYSVVNTVSDGSFGTDFAGRICGTNSTSAGLSDDGSVVVMDSSCADMDPSISPRSGGVYVHHVATVLGPRIVGQADRQPNQYGWYNGDVTITWSLIDPSGQYGPLQGPTQTVVSNDEYFGDITSPQSCDATGDCITGHYYLSVDQDAPIITGSVQVAGIGQGGNVALSLPAVEPNGGYQQSGIPDVGDYSPTPPGYFGAEYFVDHDPGVGNATPIPYSSYYGKVMASIPDPGTGHLIGVRVRDKAGNWSTTATYPSNVAPLALGSPSWSANPITTGQTTNLSVPASDNLSGVAGGEYYLGSTDPGVGNGTPMTYDGSNIDASLGSTLSPGTYSVNVRAEDTAGNWSGVTTTNLVVNPSTVAPSITSPSSLSVNARDVVNFTVTTTGTPTPAITETGSLPTGISFTDNGDGTGTFSGQTSPTNNGYYFLTLTATSSAGTTTQSFELSVNNVQTTPMFVSATSDIESYGVPVNFTVDTTGNPVPHITKNITVPTGMTWTDNGDGTATLGGTPNGNAGGNYTFTFKAKNSTGTATQTFMLTITKAPVFKNVSTSASTATVGNPFSLVVTTGGSAVPSLSESGTLPSGVSFTDNGDGTGSFTGTPTVGSGGTYPVTLTAANPSGSTTKAVTLTVNETPTITSSNTATATSGTALSFPVVSSGYPAPKLSLTGVLPAGISFHTGTGILSGTAKAGTAGSYHVTITAMNSTGTTTQSFTLTVR